MHGILVQLPLPKHIDAEKVLDAIDPDKDVDGFHPVNVGRLSVGERALVPCTPTGSVILAKIGAADLSGLDAVVDRPLQHRRQADGAAAAARELHRDDRALAHQGPARRRATRRPRGRRRRQAGDGEGRLDQARRHRHRRRHQPRPSEPDGKSKLVGDVAYDEAAKVAGAITPVPGGVGPMTIACLLKNTVEAAKMQRGLPMACTR